MSFADGFYFNLEVLKGCAKDNGNILDLVLVHELRDFNPIA